MTAKLDRNKQIIELIQSGKTLESVANQFGVSRQAIHSITKRSGLNLKHRLIRHQSPINFKKLKLWIQNPKSVSKETDLKYRKYLGLPVSQYKGRRPANHPKASKYAHLSLDEIANEINNSSVAAFARKYAISGHIHWILKDLFIKNRWKWINTNPKRVKILKETDA